jgi:hypothetical protein
MVSPGFPNNRQVRGGLGGFLSGDNGEAIGVRFLFRHRYILPLQRG